MRGAFQFIISWDHYTKVKGLNWNLNPDLWNAGAVFYQLSYQANWELVDVWVNDKPIDDG